MTTVVVGLNVREAQGYALEHRDSEGLRAGQHIRITSVQFADRAVKGLGKGARVVVLARCGQSRQYGRLAAELRRLKDRGVEVINA